MDIFRKKFNSGEHEQDFRSSDPGKSELKDKLTQYHDMLKYIIEYDHNAIAVLDRELKYVYVSRRFLLEYNVKEKEVLGKNHYDIFPNLPDNWKEAHRRALSGEVTSSEEDSFINTDGRLIWVRWECRPWYELNGGIGGIVLYTEIITRQKQIETDLILAKERAEKSEESMSDILSKLNEAQHIGKIGSWEWDIKTGKVWWSNELYNIFEVDPAAYIPSIESNARFVHPEDNEPYNNAALNSINTGERLDYQLRIIASSGKIKHCRSLAKVHFDEKGDALRMSGTFTDISDQISTMNELNAAKERAEESDRLKTAFLQNISHEVRTPLNSIVGFAELMSEPGQSLQKMNSFSKIISANSQKLIRIISDVIEISQIHSKQIRMVMSNFDIVTSLYKTANTFMEITQLKEVELIINQNIPEENSVIQSDKGKIEKIFFHLIDNAVKFTQHGLIVVDINLENDVINFSIKDSGIGIPYEKQKLIFDPFRQLETGLSRSYGGTGLGLTIVRAYTESLKGKISLASEPGTGTHVAITIPVKTITVDKKDIQKEHDHNSVNTILIAEDEYSNFKYLYEVLHSDNIEILHANNGKEAVDICRKSDDIKMILMDLKMPVMDGTTAAKQIKEFRPSLPIIAQTAYLPEETSDNNPVFDDLIAKPISRNDLREKISKYIDVSITSLH